MTFTYNSFFQCLIYCICFECPLKATHLIPFLKTRGRFPSLSQDTDFILLSCFSYLYIYLSHSKTSSISVSLQSQCISFPSLPLTFSFLVLSCLSRGRKSPKAGDSRRQLFLFWDSRDRMQMVRPAVFSQFLGSKLGKVEAATGSAAEGN